MVLKWFGIVRERDANAQSIVYAIQISSSGLDISGSVDQIVLIACGYLRLK